MYSYKTNLATDWGTLFGLNPKELTDEQFKNINFNKLIEFLDTDPRAENILCEKIMVAPITEIQRIAEIYKTIPNFPNLLAKYNDFLKTRRHEINKDNSYGLREKLVIWDLLDDENKTQEYSSWLKGQRTIIREDIIDFRWLFNNNSILADDLVKKILGGVGQHSQFISHSALNLISNLPREEYIKALPEIFTKSKYFYINALSNPETPDEYTIKALRAANVITTIPAVKAKINNCVLDQLPPIMRLNILEKIVQSGNSRCTWQGDKKIKDNPLVDIKSPDDLKQLLFSSITKHSDRVSKLIKDYKILVNWREGNEQI
jgi:hypothetical protein